MSWVPMDSRCLFSGRRTAGGRVSAVLFSWWRGLCLCWDTPFLPYRLKLPVSRSVSDCAWALGVGSVSSLGPRLGTWFLTAFCWLVFLYEPWNPKESTGSTAKFSEELSEHLRTELERKRQFLRGMTVCELNWPWGHLTRSRSISSSRQIGFVFPVRGWARCEEWGWYHTRPFCVCIVEILYLLCRSLCNSPSVQWGPHHPYQNESSLSKVHCHYMAFVWQAAVSFSKCKPAARTSKCVPSAVVVVLWKGCTTVSAYSRLMLIDWRGIQGHRNVFALQRQRCWWSVLWGRRSIVVVETRPFMVSAARGVGGYLRYAWASTGAWLLTTS